MQGRDIAVGKGLQGRGAQHRREVELAAHRLDEALRRGQGKDSQAQRPPARRARTTAETAPTAGAASLDAPPHQRPARTSVMRVSMLALAVCVHEQEGGPRIGPLHAGEWFTPDNMRLRTAMDLEVPFNKKWLA